MKTISCTIIWIPLALAMPLGCASEPPPSSEDSEISARGRPPDDRLADRARIAESGRYLVQSRAGLVPTIVTSFSDALDIPETSVVTAAVVGPDQASAILSNLGIINPIRGTSFVALSTGVVGATGPEPGTDFDPAGVGGDSVTLTLDLQVPAGANTMSLQYNFLSSESPDFIGSAFNDTFSIQLVDGAGTRDFTLASVNSSQFFDVSDSRAKDTKFDIYTDNPSEVDNVFGSQGLPDAGLTDFQSFNVSVTGSAPLTVRFTITDNGDGILDSEVLLDALQFSAIETIDPNPDLVLADGTLTSDLDVLTTGGRYVRGAVADGATEVLLRMKAPEAGNATFSVLGAGAPADGALSTVGGNERRTSVSSAAVLATGGQYVLVVYRAPADFNQNDGAERTVQIHASFAPASGGADLNTQIDLQIRRPPVVLAHGLWSRTLDWQKLSITKDPRYSITYADHSYSCVNELRVVLPDRNLLTCPLTPDPLGFALCLNDRSNKIGQATREAIANVQRLGLAATKADLVAHGAGGLLARQYINSAGYEIPSNRLQGDVSRLITISTPHFGTPVVNAIVNKRNGLTDPSSFLCTARLNSSAPSESGDIDDLTTANSALAATSVPSHAVIGSGGRALTQQFTRLKLRNKFSLYSSSGIISGTSNLATIFGTNDHDLFASVDSQRGGIISDLATSSFLMNTTNALVVDDSDFFNSLSDPRISGPTGPIVDLLNSPVGGPKFGQFAASPLPLVKPSSSNASSSDQSLIPENATLRIVSHTTGTEVFAGDEITVEVAVENFIPQSVSVMADRSFASSDTAPFKMTLRIPPDALGPIRLLAVGVDENEEALFSDAVVLVVKTRASIDSVAIVTQDPILFGAGVRRQLATVGHYNDDVTRDITSSFAGTVYLSSNPGIVVVSSDGNLVTVQPGIATVVAQNGGVQDSITVTVKGNTKPVAVARGDASLSCVAPEAQVPVQLDGSASFDPDGDPLELTWSEGGVVLASGPTPTIGLGVGVHVIDLQVSDGQGGSAHATVSVSIFGDTVPPSLTVLGANPRAVECGTPYTDEGATAVDACDGDLTADIVSQSHVNTSVPGSYSVDYQVHDRAGLAGTAARSVTVQDTTPPALACPSPTVAECTSSGQAVVDPGDATASDSCTNSTVTDPGSSSYTLGTTLVTYSAQDDAGNQTSCSTNVTVQDTLAPNITCPGPIVAECESQAQAYVTPGQATASDVCTAATVTGPDPGFYPLGTTVVTYTSSDTTGNQASCTSAINVVDTTPPQVSVTPPAPLWPANHRYRTISLNDCNIVLEDSCSGRLAPGAYQAAITCVTSDEPDNAAGPGDGTTTNDIIIVNGTTVRLRAERDGADDGRVYKIHFRVRDDANNTKDGVCSVTVPHHFKDLADDSGVASSVCR